MTTSPPDHLNIAELRRLHESARPGPWYAGTGDMVGTVVTADGDRVCSDDIFIRTHLPDFDLIAAARNALPALLDEIERLRADLQRAREAHAVAEQKVDEMMHGREACAYCGEFYPSPVHLHHTADECRRTGPKGEGAAVGDDKPAVLVWAEFPDPKLGRWGSCADCGVWTAGHANLLDDPIQEVQLCLACFERRPGPSGEGGGRG